MKDAQFLFVRMPQKIVSHKGVLFDGNVPTLIGLDGDMWASQLLILKLTAKTLLRSPLTLLIHQTILELRW